MWCLLHFVCRACGSKAIFKVKGEVHGTEVSIDGGEVVQQWIASHRMPEPMGAEINVP